MIAKHTLHRTKLNLVAEWRRGAMGVDIVDVLDIHLGPLQGSPHRAIAAIAILGGCRDVMSITAEAITDDLGINLGTALLGVLVFFQNDDAGAFAHDEAVTALIPGPRAGRRIVVISGRQGA